MKRAHQCSVRLHPPASSCIPPGSSDCLRFFPPRKKNRDSAVISPFLHNYPSNPASLAPCRPLSSLVLLLLTP